MSDINSIPPLSSATVIVNPNDGKPTANYILWFASLLSTVKTTINTIAGQIISLQNVQAALVSAQAAATAANTAAAAAQATADTGAGGGGATSGQSQGTIPVGGSFSSVALVSLTGVVAGNLTITGSGPQQGTGTTMNVFTSITGNWRILEVIGGVDTQVFGGTFNCTRSVEDGGGIGEVTFLWNETDTSATSIPRTTTGTMDYRLELQGAPGVTISNVIGYLYVRRAP